MDLKQELEQLEKALNNNKIVEKTNNINITKKTFQQTRERKIQRKKIKNIKDINILLKNIKNPIWISVSEAAKLGGVQTKTIRRAIQSKAVKYRVVGNRYLIDTASTIIYLNSKTKLKNKFKNFGLGQYVEKWQE